MTDDALWRRATPQPELPLRKESFWLAGNIAEFAELELSGRTSMDVIGNFHETAQEPHRSK
jgi:hypothetical protein